VTVFILCSRYLRSPLCHALLSRTVIIHFLFPQFLGCPSMCVCACFLYNNDTLPSITYLLPSSSHVHRHSLGDPSLLYRIDVCCSYITGTKCWHDTIRAYSQPRSHPCFSYRLGRLRSRFILRGVFRLNHHLVSAEQDVFWVFEERLFVNLPGSLALSSSGSRAIDLHGRLWALRRVRITLQ